jgi:hypothetical protein
MTGSRRRSDWLEGAVGVVALVALLAPTAGLLFDRELAGWAPGHGHAGAATVLAAHPHPYDRAGSEADTAASQVTFTPSDDASGAPMVALGREPVELPSTVRVQAGEAGAEPEAIDGDAPGVPTPPPRT